MTFLLKDRVQVTTTTTGTGPLTLGAASAGYQDFSVIGAPVAWNVTAAVYLQSFNIILQEPNSSGLFFKPDGLKMYITGTTGDEVNEYDLSVAWDISTSVYLQNFIVAAQEITPTGLFFKPDGLKMYIIGSTGDDVNEYDLSTAWDISTSVYLQNFSVAAQDASPAGLFFKPDGTKMYIAGGSGDDVNEYDLSTAWDISTSVYLQNFSILAQDTGISDLFFKPDGTKMYITGIAGDDVNEYDLSTAWDISTSVYLQNFSVAAQETNPAGLFFKPDGLKMYIIGPTTDSVYEYDINYTNQTYYTITNGVDWEVGIGIYTPSEITLSRDQVFASSNSGALVNWDAGDKTVFIPLPAETAGLANATADNSSIGTNGIAFDNFQKKLQRSVNGGVAFKNNDTNGVVSTFSLVYTAATAYSGGVLAQNGDIHFVPQSANRGQKISAAGVVSTYSLVRTGTSQYLGGVLASNGDVHFIAAGAPVGQKISSSGVVSTYSLVYTGSQTYIGGVVAPNGDIQFAPYSAEVGQKISAAGIVSTYSLVYTTTTAYGGGVLAPNGDIHFIPLDATVGQKISASGVVSTYSLVYTAATAYLGGVLAPNGDIHFVPFSANIGQKISSSGVVSTYSLTYAPSVAYQGGVLAPNGDIHFIPRSANRGQKVSALGVVSTYSLAFTTANAYRGGVLAPDGSIIFIPWSAPLGQRISTCAAIPFPSDVCLSSYLNKF